MVIKPSFFIIGAQKAGTTTLHDWLVTSPEVLLPGIKETHFFSDAERYNLGIGWYEKQFGPNVLGSKSVVGEVDPDYLFFPEAAVRIQQVVSSPKLIVMLREPVDRARSQYLMSCRRGYEKLSFIDALCAERDRCAEGARFNLDNHSYIARGLYSEQITRWKKIFTSSEMLFVKFDDLFNHEKHDETIRKICMFLGVNRDIVRCDISKKSNQASEPRFTFLRDMLYGKSKIKRVIGSCIPSRDLKLKIALWLDKVNLRPAATRQVGRADALPTFVHELFLADLKKCAGLIGLNVDDWIAFHETAIGMR